MKVGLVRRGYSASGGAEKFLLRFAEGLRARGDQPVFFVGKKWQAGPDDEVVRLDDSSPVAFANGLRLARGQCDRLLSLERVWGCDLYRAGDGVHQAWLERRKAIEPVWRSWTRGFSSKHRAMMELEAAIVGSSGNCSKVIVNSKMVADEIATYYPDRSQDDVELIYNGYDPAQLPEEMDRVATREKVRQELGVPLESPLALFVGSGWERKGLACLIEAFKGMGRSDAYLAVAGRGKPTSAWKGAENIRFLGARSDVPKLLMAADVFALPTYYDPFSNATLEAARHGLPVITTTANGFCEVMEDGVHGTITKPGDVAGVRHGLECWLKAPLDDELFGRCLENAKPFTIERNVQATINLLCQ